MDTKVSWFAVPFIKCGQLSLNEPDETHAYYLEPKHGDTVSFDIRNQLTSKSFRYYILLDLKGLSERTGYDLSHLTRLIVKGLPFYTFDNKKWFILQEVEEWFTKQDETKSVRGPQWGRVRFKRRHSKTGKLIIFRNRRKGFKSEAIWKKRKLLRTSAGQRIGKRKALMTNKRRFKNLRRYRNMK